MKPITIALFVMMLGVISTGCKPDDDYKVESKEVDWMRGHYGVEAAVQSFINVEGFDVDTCVEQLHQMGASWIMLKMQKNKMQMIAPNATWDNYWGNSNLTADIDIPLLFMNKIAEKGYKIKVFLYFNVSMQAGANSSKWAPIEVRRALGWGINGDGAANDTFINRMCRIYEEFGDRYGDKLAACVLDGMWSADFQNRRAEWSQQMTSAFRSGYPNRKVSINTGAGPEFWGVYDPTNNFISGEFKVPVPLPLSPLPPKNGIHESGAQWHGWIPLGGTWLLPAFDYFTNDELKQYYKDVKKNYGSLTFQLVIQNNEYGGFVPGQVSQIISI